MTEVGQLGLWLVDEAQDLIPSDVVDRIGYTESCQVY